MTLSCLVKLQLRYFLVEEVFVWLQIELVAKLVVIERSFSKHSYFSAVLVESLLVFYSRCNVVAYLGSHLGIKKR